MMMLPLMSPPFSLSMPAWQLWRGLEEEDGVDMVDDGSCDCRRTVRLLGRPLEVRLRRSKRHRQTSDGNRSDYDVCN